MADLSIELQPVITAALQQQTTDVTDVTDTVETESERQEFSLPPVDHGKDAYLFLGACFTVEGLVWGFPFAFWRVPRLLQHSRALCRLIERRHHRNLRHGECSPQVGMGECKWVVAKAVRESCTCPARSSRVSRACTRG